MERKSGSSSRSPSVSRRSSLKEKKISKQTKRKTSSGTSTGGQITPSGSKKERWLLTRKTWRYMQDAVGNLLPSESHRSSRRDSGAAATTTTTSPPSSSYGNFEQQAQISARIQQFEQQLHAHIASTGKLQSAEQQTSIQAARAAFLSGIDPPSTGIKGHSDAQSVTARLLPEQHSSQAHVHPFHHGRFHIGSDFHHASGSSGSGTCRSPDEGDSRASGSSTKEFSSIEQNFEAVCNRQKRFLLWHRNRAKGLSGPALRELKLLGKQQDAEQKLFLQQQTNQLYKMYSTSGAQNTPCCSCSYPHESRGRFYQIPLRCVHTACKESREGSATTNTTEEYPTLPLWGDDEDFLDDDDDYDEYGAEDEQQFQHHMMMMMGAQGQNVRERRKSSTTSIYGHPSGFQKSGGQATGSTGAETSYGMIVSGSGTVQKVFRNTGIQTEPFPEELLVKLKQQQAQQLEEEQNLQAAQQNAQQQGGKDGHSGKTGSVATSSMVASGNSQVATSGLKGQTSEGKTAISDSSGSTISSSGSQAVSRTEGNMAPSGTIIGATPITEESEPGAEREQSSSDVGSTSGAPDQTDKKSEESGYSSSISDTVMRYLRMVRRNSKADTKDPIDKFKTVNYDRSLRYIKSKNVSVEEALEHEKNKALQLQNKGNGDSTTPVPEPSAPTVPTSQPSSSPATTGKKSRPSEGAPKTTKTKKSSPSSAGVSTTTNIESTDQPTAPTASSPVPVTKPSHPETSTTVMPSSTPSIPTSVPQASPLQGDITPQVQSAASSAPQSPPNPGTPTATLPPGGIFPTPPQPPPSVGTQAGESLVRFLKNFNPPRKFSDFSSATSYCSSESPVEVTSPRYSIATTVMSSASEAEWIQQQQALLTMMSNSGIGGYNVWGTATPTQRGSIDIHSIGDSSECDDVFNASTSQGSFPHYFSRSVSSSGATAIQKSSSAQQIPGPGTIFQPQSQQPSGSGTFYPEDLPSTGSSSTIGAPPTTTSAKSKPAQSSSGISSPTTSSGSAASLVKNFFSGNPFGKATSTLGLKKPASTSALTSTGGSGTTLTSSTSHAKASGGLQMAPPPTTTSSSPNLLSLIHSSTSNLIRGGGVSPSSSLGSSSTHPQHVGNPLSNPGGSSSFENIGRVQTAQYSVMGSKGAHSQGSKTMSQVSFKDKSGTGTSGHSSSGQWGRDSSGQGGDVGESRMLTSRIGQSSSKSYHHPRFSTGVDHSSSWGAQQPSSFPGGGSGSINPSMLMSGGSSNPSTVMQKSKSSSSVVPLYHQQQTHHGSSGSDRIAPTASSQQSSVSPVYTTGSSGQFVGQGSGATVSSGQVASTSGPSTGAGAPSSTSKLISKSSKIFKSRSKSNTRAPSSSVSSTATQHSWSPQGRCKWKSASGRQVTLEGTTVFNLMDVERTSLQDVALEKLRTLNLGVDVKIPKEKTGAAQHKPKRRPYLLKKKALSTGFFESGSKQDSKESGIGGGSGMVFGIPLSQCVNNDRMRRLKTATLTSTNGASDAPPARDDRTGSNESLYGGKRGSIIAADGASQEPTLNVEGSSVPWIVTACVKHLETYGLHTTGIFRVSTSLKRIRQLREEIDSGKEVEFGEEHSPHDVAALLKEFLRDLPEPLLCRDLYQPFLRTQRIRNRKTQMEAFQYLVHLLPVQNRDTLGTLLRFFANVVANADERRSRSGEIIPGNKMEGYSLATLIAPNILPCMPTEGLGSPSSTVEQNPALTRERRESIDVVNYMISNYRMLFEISPELLHDVYLHIMDTQPDVIDFILRAKYPSPDELEDVETTSSVFEGSECGEGVSASDLLEGDQPLSTSRYTRRREDVVHESGGTGGHSEVSPYTRRGRRGKRDSEPTVGGRDAESEKQQSGGESDTSITSANVKSRWFRRSRDPSKARTSSDSGSEKGGKSKSKSTSDKVQSTSSSRHHLSEPKRANSLDSVNLKIDSVVSPTDERRDSSPGKVRSSSDQSLKVPTESLTTRRQSSPVLDTWGVITASLRIPVPMPLHVDDPHIPYIEEDGQRDRGAGDVSSTGPHGQPSPVTGQMTTQQHSTGVPRARSASTDSSAMLKTTTSSSSHNTTPISSPLRQPSSEVSSPLGFSPPSSPPYDPNCFPYEEMTGRILLGSSSATLLCPDSSPCSSLTPSPSSTMALTSKSGEPIEQAYDPSNSGLKTPGKETKAANIAGLIKSKTADFEKLAGTQSITSSATITPAPTATSSSSLSAPPTEPVKGEKIKESSSSANVISSGSIAPKMRLRSQDNIVLKQQFLLRQQSQEANKGSSGPSKSSSSTTISSTTGEGRKHRPVTRRRPTGTVVDGSSGVAKSTASRGGLSKSSSVPHHPAVGGSAAPPGGSRWKRSDIVSSSSHSDTPTPTASPSPQNPSTSAM